MPIDGKRIQKRTPATVALQVTSAKQPLISELAFTENFSLHGLRVVTERAWKPGEPDRQVLPRQHPVGGKGDLLSSIGRGTICRWLGVAFGGGTWADVLQPPSPRAEV
jgi:hypothetical protein